MADLTKVKENLEKKGFIVNVFDTGAEATAHLASEISDKTVGFGGSMTLKEIGLYEELSKNNEVVWHWKLVDYNNLFNEKTKDPSNIRAARDAAMHTDIYISSANALAETGEIVNIDGAGNRVASTLWGHSKVIFVISANKLEPNYEKAVWRARNIAAPKRAASLNKKTPCAIKVDKCYDCNSDERICRGMVTIWKPMQFQEFEVVLIQEDHGM